MKKHDETKVCTARDVEREIHKLQSPVKAALSARFFKTGKGEYSEGDIFLGLTVPETRTIVKKYWRELPYPEVEQLLTSKFHEVRLAALHILVARYKASATHKERKTIFTLYTKHTKHINNWDLVDASAAQIVGPYISEEMEHEERLRFIEKYCQSTHLWENRIIVVASHYQIKKGNEKLLFFVARKLMHHPHDLMHKAIGWMLREVGKQERTVLTNFLTAHAHEMPRTMLRYALEHYGEKERAHFMMQKRIREQSGVRG